MKSLIVVLALFSTCNALFKFNVPAGFITSWERTIEPFRAECLAKSGLDRKVLYDALLTMQFPESPKFKCFAECTWTHLGYYDLITKQINAEKIGQEVKGFTKEIAEKCYNEHKADGNSCEIVFSIIKCGIEKM
uniref:Uncharacterized protein n=1 Tax=Photinus pyralis TaxID=7054 RepID=A0A1Y1L184_PHOPY